VKKRERYTNSVSFLPINILIIALKKIIYYEITKLEHTSWFMGTPFCCWKKSH